MAVYYINGEYVDAEKALISASDLAVLRGYGVFDYLRTYGGVPFQLGAHLRRLQRSATLIELACPWDIEELGEIVSGDPKPQLLCGIGYSHRRHRRRQPQRLLAQRGIAPAGDGDADPRPAGRGL